MNTPEHPEWTSQVTALLDASTRELDAATVSRLNRARHAALARARHKPGRSLWAMTGVAATVCAMLLALGVWHGRAPKPGHAPTITRAAAAKSGAETGNDSGDSLELYQDLDFYAWLDEQQGSQGS